MRYILTTVILHPILNDRHDPLYVIIHKILLNLGGTSAGLDIHLHPKQDMEGGSVTLAQGVGGQKATFPYAMCAGDDVAILASTRQCTRNGVKETKDGFYQYSAAWDSKHIVSLPQGKSAQLLYSMQEMDDGETPL